MQKYEMVYILRTNLPENELEARNEKAATIIAEHKGEITHRDHWGVRRLAYEIDHETTGNYMLLRFNAEESAPKTLDRQFRMDDKVLRHLVVVDEEWTERNRAAREKMNAQAAERVKDIKE